MYFRRLFFCSHFFIFFFFKQKTAYEMRISDWSSDVCSSDLLTQFVYRAKLEKTTSNRYRDFVTTVDFCRLFPDILFNALLSLLHQPSITRHHSDPLFEACSRMRAFRRARTHARLRPAPCREYPHRQEYRWGGPAPQNPHR